MQRDITSILSLATMSGAAIYALLSLFLMGYPLWTMYIFVFIIIGGQGGLLWELFGNNNDLISSIRRANVGLVMASSLSTYLIAVRYPWTNGITFMITALATFLSIEGALAKASPLRLFCGLCIQHIIEITIVYQSELDDFIKLYLILASIINMSSFILPRIKFVSFLLGESGAFHILNTITTILLYNGLKSIIVFPYIQISFQWIVIGFLAAIFIVFTSRIQRNYVRFIIANFIWSLIYKLLLSTSFPSPTSISTYYGNKIKWIPYHEKYPKAYPLSILSAAYIPNSQKFGELSRKINFLFRIISQVDKFLPQSDVSESIIYKDRIKVLDPEFYVPSFIETLGKKNRFNIPKTLETYHSYDQALVWMVLYGHCSTMLKKISESDSLYTHMIDLSWLEKYHPKKDCYGYGGKAYFTQNPITMDLTLQSIHLPEGSKIKPSDSQFKNALTRILSSTGFVSVAGFHLIGIHMLLNLITVSLYNTFSVNFNKNCHPFYAIMNIHFYNHCLVEEITTAHLVEKGAVFSQIFALKHEDMCTFINDYFCSIEFGSEADLESRIEVLGIIPRYSQIEWQLEYKKIFKRYAEKVVDIMYPNEMDLQNDTLISNFYDELNSTLESRRGGAPGLQRFSKFSEKKYLVNFITDCMHIAIVSHKVYGTKVPEYAVHPTLMPSQVHLDFSLPSIDDYMSLIFVTAATSRVNFTLLLSVDANIVFGNVQPDDIRIGLIQSFNDMKQDLVELGIRWSSDVNEQYQRCLPSELECAAGY